MTQPSEPSPQEVINAIALTRLTGCPQSIVLELYRRLGSATEIIDQRDQLPSLFPDIHQRISQAFEGLGQALQRAEEE